MHAHQDERRRSPTRSSSKRHPPPFPGPRTAPVFFRITSARPDALARWLSSLFVFCFAAIFVPCVRVCPVRRCSGSPWHARALFKRARVTWPAAVGICMMGPPRQFGIGTCRTCVARVMRSGRFGTRRELGRGRRLAAWRSPVCCSASMSAGVYAGRCRVALVLFLFPNWGMARVSMTVNWAGGESGIAGRGGIEIGGGSRPD